LALAEVKLNEVRVKRTTPSVNDNAGMAFQVSYGTLLQALGFLFATSNNIYSRLTRQPRTSEIAFEQNVKNVISLMNACQVRFTLAANIEIWTMNAAKT
jgi:hypothetical protein